jgi:hypothetical protein
MIVLIPTLVGVFISASRLSDLSVCGPLWSPLWLLAWQSINRLCSPIQVRWVISSALTYVRLSVPILFYSPIWQHPIVPFTILSGDAILLHSFVSPRWGEPIYLPEPLDHTLSAPLCPLTLAPLPESILLPPQSQYGTHLLFLLLVILQFESFGFGEGNVKAASTDNGLHWWGWNCFSNILPVS